MKPVVININGKDVQAFVMKDGNTLWAHLNGRTLVYEPESSKTGKKKQTFDDPTKIVAPMPGKIIKVLCQEGDLVKKDQTLVVMEAMKMEYSLKALANAQVKKLNAKAGSQASLGDVLVDLSVENVP